MKVLRKLCNPAEIASRGVVSRSASMEYTLHCISVQLQVDSPMLERAVAGCCACAAVSSFEMGLAGLRAEE